MKKFLISILIFCFLIINSSCNILGTLIVASEFCTNVSLFPSKNYEELIKANDFFQYNNDKYYVKSDDEIIHGRPSFFDPLCCKCKKISITLLKNYVNIPEDGINGSEYFSGKYNYDPVKNFFDYKPQKVFIVYKENKFIFEFAIDENTINTENINLRALSLKNDYYFAILLLKNSKNEEITLKDIKYNDIEDAIKENNIKFKLKT